MNFDDLLGKFKSVAPSKIPGANVNSEALRYITAGDKAFKDDNYSQAITHFSKAIELKSQNRYPLSKRGKCYQMLQEYDKALIDLFKSKELDDNFENNQSVAECYLFKKEFLHAVQYFEAAIERIEHIEKIDTGKILGIDYGATKARTLNNQATCYYNLQQLDKAISATTKGIEANPSYPNNYKIRGLIHFSQGNKSQARTDLQNAARLGDQQAHAILAQM